MNLISVKDISKYRGEKLLFEKGTFGISTGEKLALIGNNGSGKSTLMRILRGEEEADGGDVIRNRSLRIGLLDQDPRTEKDESLADFLFRGAGPVLELIQQLLLAVNRNEDASDIRDELRKQNFLEQGEFAFELLSILNLPGPDTPASTLSGGMIRKAALARVLLEENDILFLDEPTNHLDMESIQWLEDYLIRDSRALLLVTHDRYFLDRITNRILEIEDGTIAQYQGGYSAYLETREALRQQREASEDRARNFLRKEIEWLRRQPKARGTKQKARIDRIEAVQNRDPYRTEEKIEFSTVGSRSGKRILDLKNVTAKRGDRILFEDFSYTFMAKDRVGVVGPNGAGKSTLLELISGRLNPSGGHISRGQNTVIAYFDQMNQELNPAERVIDYIKREVGPSIENEDGSRISASDLLERFLFPPAIQYSPVGKLSGGERRRLHFVRLLMTNPNFLILDEPTNDLDIKTLSVLEEFLEDFPGSVIIVSHDRYFLDRIAGHLFVLDGSSPIQGFPGSCSDYLESERFQREKTRKEGTSSPSSGKKEKIREKTGISPVRQETGERKDRSDRKQRVRIRELEKEIEKIETDLSTCKKKLSGTETDPDKLVEAGKKHQELETLLEKKMEEWEALMA